MLSMLRRFFNNLNYNVSLKAVATKRQESDQYFFNIAPKTFAPERTLAFATFDIYYSTSSTECKYDDETCTKTLNWNWTYIKPQLKSSNGPLFIVLVTTTNTTDPDYGDITLVSLEEIGPTTLNIFLQIPQYTILTIGECLFSITGLGFAYTQAPVSMKSLLTAAWLLTVAFGNIIIIIIDEVVSGEGKEAFLFFLFAGLLAVVTVVFAIMTLFYTYVTPAAEADEDCKSNKSFSSSSSDSSASGVEKEKNEVEGQQCVQERDVTAKGFRAHRVSPLS